MSNWAKLQEDLMGKPVFKRAKHGIHFQNNDGSITANFSGKPCHYQDGGIWKPIDTKLVLLPDGFYGCPHSPVKVHPDGRVKVEGYQQRAELPSAKVGKADNDKLIREFSFGSQELRITEDGFRSEITLNRIPTLTEARKLIASESGTLSGKYRKSDTTATDANGDSHTFSTLAAFRTWLAGAKFPVVIDPDFSVQPDADAGMDTHLASTSPNSNYGSSSEFNIQRGSAWWGRGLLKFDLSSIEGEEIVAATQYYTPYANVASTTTTYMRRILSGNSGWTEMGATYNTKDGANAWAGAAGCTTEGTDFSATNMGTNSLAYTANTETLMDLNTDEFTEMVSANYGCVVYVTTDWVQKKWWSSDAATAAYRPRLSVTYTAGGGVSYVPKINMVGQMQNLNGLRG